MDERKRERGIERERERKREKEKMLEVNGRNRRLFAFLDSSSLIYIKLLKVQMVAVVNQNII